MVLRQRRSSVLSSVQLVAVSHLLHVRYDGRRMRYQIVVCSVDHASLQCQSTAFIKTYQYRFGATGGRTAKRVWQTVRTPSDTGCTFVLRGRFRRLQYKTSGRRDVVLCALRFAYLIEDYLQHLFARSSTGDVTWTIFCCASPLCALSPTNIFLAD